MDFDVPRPSVRVGSVDADVAAVARVADARPFLPLYAAGPQRSYSGPPAPRRWHAEVAVVEQRGAEREQAAVAHAQPILEPRRRVLDASGQSPHIPLALRLDCREKVPLGVLTAFTDRPYTNFVVVLSYSRSLYTKLSSYSVHSTRARRRNYMGYFSLQPTVIIKPSAMLLLSFSFCFDEIKGPPKSPRKIL